MSKSKVIPFNIPYLSGDEYAEIAESLDSRQHCGNHTYAKKCIELLKKRYKFLSVYLTPSCTSALEMGTMLCGLKEGDEVIMPSYTFSSTANAVALRGAKPVFCDVDPSTMNIDTTLIERLVTEKTKMILPIDYAGIPCNIDEINKIAEKHKLFVMQDAAQSLGSYHSNDQACGAAANLATFSFHETKNVTCGEGGALIVNEEAMLERANILQEKGTDRHKVIAGIKSKYSWVDIGSSFLLSDILASMLYVQLLNNDKIVEKRKVVVDKYNQVLIKYEKSGCLKLPKPDSKLKLNYHAYFIIFDTEENKESFLSKLRDKNVSAYIGYIPLHSSSFGESIGYQKQDIPVTEDIAKRIVRLPLFADLAEDENLEYCVDSIERVLLDIYDIQ